MKTDAISIHQKWMAFFGLWLLFLTGIFSNIAGSPGILQAIRLKNLLTIKQEQVAKAQSEIQNLKTEAVQLENNRAAQIREIRRVLGYAASDELIFDFGPDN